MTDFEIKTFLSLVETKNMTRSAENLSITQSALSKKLENLETELGYKLFDRQRGVRNISLTPKGTAFLPVAEKWSALMNQAVSIRSFSPKKELALAVSNTFTVGLMPKVLPPFMKEHPNIKLSVYDYHSLDIYKHITKGDVDFGFVVFPVNIKGICTYPAFIEPSVFICGKGSTYPPVINPLQLRLTDCIFFDYSKEVEVWYNKWFDKSNQYKMFFNTFSAHHAYAFEANTWTVFPHCATEVLLTSTNLETRELSSPPADRCVYYVYKEDTDNLKLIQDFLKQVNKAVAADPHLKSFIIK